MKLAALVLVCGCNAVFGLSPTTGPGTTFFDAPIDAPFACPPIGTNLPPFTGVLVQQILEDCSQYSPSDASGRAVASCSDPAGGEIICEGPRDQMLTSAFKLSAIQAQPRLSPDGNTIYVHDNAPSITVIAYQRTGMTWTRAPASDIGQIANASEMSSVMRGPDGDHILFTAASATSVALAEWSNAGGTWHQTSLHPASELGLQGIFTLALTSDGLRALVFGFTPTNVDQTLYTDRPALDAPFRAAQKIDGLFGVAQDASLSDDCSRIYFTGLGSVFYVQE